jgi:hypothetical protein
VAAEGGETFARIGEVELTRLDLERAVTQAVRNRFYHGTVPDGAMAGVRREAAEELINRTLLLAEADRRGIEADQEAIEATLAHYDVRYAANPRWQDSRETMLAKLAEDLGDENRLGQLEAAVRRLPPPTRSQLEAYYQGHLDEFTEPARMRVSLILLGVAPSAPGEAWDAAFREARQIVDLLDEGADFAELARLRSADESASSGGDMGYLHAGMLGAAVEQALNELRPGDHTGPVQVLEGVALLQLVERIEPQQREFRDVYRRVQQLWQREQGEEAWQLLIRQLREATAITIYGNPVPEASI